MSRFTFAKATKHQAFLRLALIGPSGSGKTYTALSVATNLGTKVAVIDTERGSASKYADLFDFDVLELDTFEPLTYAEAIVAAQDAGYDVIVIDSLSHAWMGKGGALEQVDRVAKRSNSSNSFGAWREVTPMHNTLVDTILGTRAHVIATMRAKTEYVQEKDERTGKTVVRKIGLAPVQRDGLEYEFDVVADMDGDNNLIVTKSRLPQMTGMVVAKPGANVADTLRAWLTSGAAQDLTAGEASDNGERPAGGASPAGSPSADDLDRESLRGRIARLTAEFVDKAKAGWTDHQWPALASEALTAEHVTVIERFLADVEKQQKQTHDRRRKHVRAKLGEAGVTAEADVDALILSATSAIGQPTDSTAALSEAQVAAIVDQLKPLIEGRVAEQGSDAA